MSTRRGFIEDFRGEFDRLVRSVARSGGTHEDGRRFALSAMCIARVLLERPELRASEGRVVYPTLELIDGEYGLNTRLQLRIGQDTLGFGMVLGELVEAIGQFSRLMREALRLEINLGDIAWEWWRLRESGVFSPEVCDLAFDALSWRVGDTVYLPFDAVGQLATRAQVLGLKIVGPSKSVPTDVSRMLRMIALGPNHYSEAEHLRVQQGDMGVVPDHVIVFPPLGDRFLDEEQSGRPIEVVYGYRRIESRVSLDFAGSLAQRARVSSVVIAGASTRNIRQVSGDSKESWLTGDGLHLDVAAWLPEGNTAKAKQAAILYRFHQEAEHSFVAFGDFTSSYRLLGDGVRPSSKVTYTQSIRYALGWASKSTQVLRERGISDGYDDFTRIKTIDVDPLPICRVSREAVGRYRSGLDPRDYVDELIGSDPIGRPLREITTLIRPPGVVRSGPSPLEVEEVTIAMLRQLQPITRETEDGKGSSQSRSVLVRPREPERHLLIGGDVVLSVKGTIGEAGVIDKSVTNDDDSKRPLVVSPSCVGIRLRESADMDWRCLLIYLWSNEGKKQLERLTSGESIQHLSVSTFRDEFEVPIFSAKQQEEMCERYEKIVAIDKEMASRRRYIEELLNAPLP